MGGCGCVGVCVGVWVWGVCGGVCVCVCVKGACYIEVYGDSEEVGRAQFNLATPTYATVAYSVRLYRMIDK